MTYLLSNETLLYLIGGTALGVLALGVLVGWFMRFIKSNRDLAKYHKKILNAQKELDEKSEEISSAARQFVTSKRWYENKITELRSRIALQSGELKLATSRWHSTLAQAKQLPIYLSWIKKVQHLYQQTLTERRKFETLASRNAAMHADANLKIRRLNKLLTDQERYKYQLNDMTSKVCRLNSRITTSESDVRGLYGMIAQVQSKWGNDRIGISHLRSAQLQTEEQKNKAQWRLAESDKQYSEKFQEQRAHHQIEIDQLQKRINELVPLEGNLPGQDSTLNRFMDKIRLVGTTRNAVLGRAYKQVNETKRKANEKERVFVDTCEEKDAIIYDLHEQVRTAENRAQATSSVALKKSTARIHELETDLKSNNDNITMLREHEHTIEAFKNKFARQLAAQTKELTKPKAGTRKAKTKVKAKAKPKKTVKAKTRKVKEKKPASKLKIPASNLEDKAQAIKAQAIRDDLKLVKGIGPTLEKKLNEINVYSYEQLAKLNSTNIKTLEESIGDFIGRIERDKWVSQSKELFKKKYGKSISIAIIF